MDELGDRPALAPEILAVDFLLQHPSLLDRFARRGHAALPPAIEPSANETESSEESLLRWKRSVGGQILAPMFGRLIARGLVQQSSNGALTLRPQGEQIAERLRSGIGAKESARLRVVAQRVHEDGSAVHDWLRLALAGGEG